MPGRACVESTINSQSQVVGRTKKDAQHQRAGVSGTSHKSFGSSFGSALGTMAAPFGGGAKGIVPLEVNTGRLCRVPAEDGRCFE
jgi:hypothetical protein